MATPLSNLSEEALLAYCREHTEVCNSPSAEPFWQERYQQKYSTLYAEIVKPANKTWYEWYMYTSQFHGYVYALLINQQITGLYNGPANAYQDFLQALYGSIPSNAPPYMQLDMLPTYLTTYPPALQAAPYIQQVTLARMPVDNPLEPVSIVALYLRTSTPPSAGPPDTTQYRLSENEFLWLGEDPLPIYVVSYLLVGSSAPYPHLFTASQVIPTDNQPLVTYIVRHEPFL
jgi:hypothetical protein